MKRTLTVFVTAFAAASALAATADDLDRLVSEALQRSPRIHALERRFDAAKASIPAARALPDPMIQVMGWGDEVTIEQPLLWPGIGRGRGDQAGAEAESLWQSHQAGQLELAEAVAAAAIEAAFRRERERRLAEGLALLETLEPVAAESVRGGASLAGLLRLQVEIETRRDELEAARSERAEIAARLAALLGREATDAPPVEIALDDALAPPPPSASLAALVESRNPELAALRALARSAEARQRLARLAGRPQIGVGAQYMKEDMGGGDSWALMLSASLPIFRDKTRALSLAGSLEREAFELEVEQERLRALGEAAAWLERWRTSARRVERYRDEILPLARQSSEVWRGRFAVGEASLVEALDAEDALLESETAYWRAVADAWLAQARLKTLTGGAAPLAQP